MHMLEVTSYYVHVPFRVYVCVCVYVYVQINANTHIRR